MFDGKLGHALACVSVGVTDLELVDVVANVVGIHRNASLGHIVGEFGARSSKVDHHITSQSSHVNVNDLNGRASVAINQLTTNFPTFSDGVVVGLTARLCFEPASRAIGEQRHDFELLRGSKAAGEKGGYLGVHVGLLCGVGKGKLGHYVRIVNENIRRNA
ncbi:hypothetical protein IB276_26135 [Ensifer sp. ENS04]|uniref:hypothetical protein n=1 Tax=Ensifer sp. ENS04 TaxID=2769281 RepID=UPI00177AC4F0|nr:hypothetical protein [Ensifer sp. ENS04]MBD9542930.1 hypothetical protein [Ensifer sp. ENS04]